MADLTAIPATITAGDSYAITLTRPDYPATAGWSLTLAVAGGAVDAWTSTPSGDAHVLTLPAVETAALTAGDYAWALKATKPGTVHTIERGALVVLSDVAQLAPGEAVSYWQNLKASAQEALKAFFDGGALKMGMIVSRQFQYESPAQCLKVIALCDMKLAALRGTGFGVPIRFDVVGLR